MDPLTASAVLAASLLHASWHALVKSSGDRVVALAGMNLVSGALALALLPFARALPLAAYFVIAGSVVLHVAYKIALARLYGEADFGQAYPLARGIAPVIATAIAFPALGDTPGALALSGIALVSLGLVVLARESDSRSISAGAVASAVLVGLTVAAYTVLDAYGVRLAGDWFSFTAWLVAADSVAFVLYAITTRGAGVLGTWRRDSRRTLASGALGVFSFSVFMWALGRAPAGPVAALRETSVLFAALIGALVLHERATWKRYAAAALVAAGIGVIALTR